MNYISSAEEVADAFDGFWEKAKIKAVDEICLSEGLISDQFKTLVDRIIYTNEDQLGEDIVASMSKAPSVLQHKKVIPRLTDRVKTFVSKFYGGM